jgi:predicted glycosyltransferase
VLLLRDFGGDVPVVRRTWDQDNAWSALDLYSQIVILGRESAYDWSSLISHVKDNMAVSYLGFLVANRLTVNSLSEKSGSLIVGGGGAHAYELFRSAINDLICFLPHPVTLCTGPLMDQQDRTRVIALANKNVMVREYIPSLERHLHSFQMTVSQAGSISSELAYAGVTAVLVPRDQESREQHMRALYWTQRARHIHLSDFDGLLNQVNTLRRDVNCNAQVPELRNALSELFVTPATVVKFILNEAIFNN